MSYKRHTTDNVFCINMHVRGNRDTRQPVAEICPENLPVGNCRDYITANTTEFIKTPPEDMTSFSYFELGMG